MNLTSNWIILSIKFRTKNYMRKGCHSNFDPVSKWWWRSENSNSSFHTTNLCIQAITFRSVPVLCTYTAEFRGSRWVWTWYFKSEATLFTYDPPLTYFPMFRMYKGNTLDVVKISRYQSVHCSLSPLVPFLSFLFFFPQSRVRVAIWELKLFHYNLQFPRIRPWPWITQNKFQSRSENSTVNNCLCSLACFSSTCFYLKALQRGLPQHSLKSIPISINYPSCDICVNLNDLF